MGWAPAPYYVFVTDGKPWPNSQVEFRTSKDVEIDSKDFAQSLRDLGVDLRAIGVGNEVKLDTLRWVDPKEAQGDERPGNSSG